MNTVIQNNEEIWLLLEKSNALFSDFSDDQVTDVETQEEYYVIVYLSEKRNFIAYKTEGHLQDKNVLPDFLNFVQQNSVFLSVTVLDKVLEIIENRIHSRDNALFYFDAH
jgi:hypothetical protein